MSQVQQESDQGLRSSLMRQMAEGREQLDRSAFEACFQIFTNALHRCETIPALEPLKYQVLGNIGWANRLVGRYKIAADTLQEALALADAAGAATQAAMARAQIEAELGTVFRMMNCHEDAREAFSRQYSISVSRQREYWGWKRVRCRAIGNLGMANYQRAIQLLSQSPDDPGIQKKTRDRIDEAISQLEERISLADDIYEDDLGWGHGAASRTYQAESWACIGLSRLSLCYTAISDLGPKEGKSYWMDKAVKTAKKGAERAVGARNSARSLSRFFYGRALLRSADEDNEPVLKEKALELFNNTTQVPKIASAAIALAMEPSTEHRGYLRELVSVGADLTSLDPDTGYTALDYAVFSGDEEAEAIIVEGLCQQLSSTGKDVGNQATTQALVEQQRTEARLRKGYREMFQERLRPILLKSYNRWRDWQYGSEGVQAALARETITTMKRIYGDGVTADRATLNEMFDQFRRRDTVLALRTAYARALAVDGNAAGTMFDQLRAVRYSDFAAFGRLPRSSDGLAKPLMGYNSIEPGDGKRSVGVGGGDEFIIFFSYRWINHDPGANSPDDANRTQYKRMVDAVESYIAHKETPDIPPEKLYIWMVWNLDPPPLLAAERTLWSRQYCKEHTLS